MSSKRIITSISKTRCFKFFKYVVSLSGLSPRWSFPSNNMSSIVEWLLTSGSELVKVNPANQILWQHVLQWSGYWPLVQSWWRLTQPDAWTRWQVMPVWLVIGQQSNTAWNGKAAWFSGKTVPPSVACFQNTRGITHGWTNARDALSGDRLLVPRDATQTPTLKHMTLPLQLGGPLMPLYLYTIGQTVKCVCVGGRG